MSFDHDNFASTSSDESSYLSLSVVSTLALALTMSVIINLILIFIVRSLSSTSPAAQSKSNTTNQTNLAEGIISKVGENEVAIILSYLPRPEIMRARVCKVWRDAAKKTIVPIDEDFEENTFDPEYGFIFDTNNKFGFKVNRLMTYYAMTVMTTALPCLQQLTIRYLGNRRTFSVGEDPDEERAAQTANNVICDINLISIFSKLRALSIDSPHLNERYLVHKQLPVFQ